MGLQQKQSQQKRKWYVKKTSVPMVAPPKRKYVMDVATPVPTPIERSPSSSYAIDSYYLCQALLDSLNESMGGVTQTTDPHVLEEIQTTVSVFLSGYVSSELSQCSSPIHHD
jgi:hypothetical protein